MGYFTFATAQKSLTKAEDIGDGQVELRHLSPTLFTELRKVSLHSHSGQGSRRINMRDLEGAFSSDGLRMYSSDGKLWKATINTSGAWVITEIT